MPKYFADPLLKRFKNVNYRLHLTDVEQNEIEKERLLLSDWQQLLHSYQHDDMNVHSLAAGITELDSTYKAIWLDINKKADHAARVVKSFKPFVTTHTIPADWVERCGFKSEASMLTQIEADEKELHKTRSMLLKSTSEISDLLKLICTQIPAILKKNKLFASAYTQDGETRMLTAEEKLVEQFGLLKKILDVGHEFQISEFKCRWILMAYSLKPLPPLLESDEESEPDSLVDSEPRDPSSSETETASDEEAGRLGDSEEGDDYRSSSLSP